MPSDRIRTVIDGREYAELEAQLAELQKPCVWTWGVFENGQECLVTSCGKSIYRDYGLKPDELFCGFCGHPISEVTEE